MRDGIAPSYLWLPEGQWPNLLAFLIQRFPHVGEAVLLQRMAKGDLVGDQGPLDANSPYRQGGRIWYYREVPVEMPVPFEAVVLHRDQRLLVVDKPHFLPMIPSGQYLHETLLIRLRKQLDLPQLTPVHRLDRETAGVVLFCLDPAYRGAYQTLFERREISKRYEAIAPYRPSLDLPHVHRSRMVESGKAFAMHEVAGEPNSETRVDLIERLGEYARYRLEPHTGRKHQLRLHMASLGIPILNDPLYPEVLAHKGEDFSKPLQLLARSIEFADPVSGELRCFTSERSLTGEMPSLPQE
ncbi:pseudouridine synthase [Chitinimonas arctica]|uniref:Pseudouridine synthase n=1 Tax=Chitinimonas arctica TaxID=2594795 RepID=A0A516SM45_9NEIS|nr:pseudouridine synthase [Chitinimonas arctica]